MPLIQLIVLALIQGITEFLPISSSAHLILVPLVVDGWSDQGAFIDVAAHVGTLVAVLLYFRVEARMLLRGGLDAVRLKPSSERQLFLLISMATIPLLAVAGIFVVFDVLDLLRSPQVIGAASIFFGVLLWHADRQPTAIEGLGRISWKEAMVIGFAQAFALVPGASRSGVTMSAARYFGWSREEAARFSMLLAIPTILALGSFAAIDLLSEGADATIQAAIIVAILSFIIAFATIAVFMKMTRSMSFTPFVIYRVVMGGVLLVFAGQLTA